VDFASAQGFQAFDTLPFDQEENNIYVAANVSEIEVHRLLKQYKLS